MRPTRTRRVAVAITASLAFALSSCGSSGDSADFCKKVESFSDFGDGEIFSGTADADALRSQVDEAKKILNEVESAAPSEIKDDAALLKKSWNDFAGALEDADYDFVALLSDENAMAAMESMGSEEVQAASERLGEYTQEHCDIEL